MHFNPFPKRQILDFSKQKEFADDNYKFDENGRKFSKRVENTGGKGEIAWYQQISIDETYLNTKYESYNLKTK